MLYLTNECYFEVNPIPQNYQGTLTFGKIRDVSVSDNILIYIYKLPLEKPLIKEAIAQADGLISFTFTEEEFFTKKSTFVIKFFKKDDLVLKKIKDPDDEANSALDVEAIVLRFNSPTISSALPYAYTLEKFGLCKNC